MEALAALEVLTPESGAAPLCYPSDVTTAMIEAYWRIALRCCALETPRASIRPTSMFGPRSTERREGGPASR
jgi:hypothetical protein